MITVTINGKAYELDRAMTVQAYLELKGLAGRQLAVAVNGVVLQKEEFPVTTVNDGDRMEVVRPVGGGA
jgi:sulfur carrier protein